MTEPAFDVAGNGDPRPDTVPQLGSRIDSSLLPPGPRGPALVQTFRMFRQPYRFLERCAERYGERFTLRLLGGRTLVMLSDSEGVKDLFSGDPEDLHAGEINRYLTPVLGWNSLLMLDGERHLRERRLLAPPFHGERLQAYGHTMRDIADAVIDTWPVGRPFPVLPHMQAITLDVIVRTVFGVDEDDAICRLRTEIGRLLRIAENPIAAFLTVDFLRTDLGSRSPWGAIVRFLREIDALLYSTIARRRAEGTAGHDDILSMLIDARDEDARGMSDQELRDEMVTLLMAGNETTATSLSWVLTHVLGRPDVLEKLGEEIARVGGGGPIEPQDLGRLEYLDAVIKETLRLNPTVHLVGRLLTRPMRFGGRELPAGVIPTASAYLVHRRADLWSAPERFEPERFLGVRPSPYHYFPFGGGVRRCVGGAFGIFEMKVVLAAVLFRVVLRLEPGYHPRPVQRPVTIAPSKGVPVIVDTRRPALGH